MIINFPVLKMQKPSSQRIVRRPSSAAKEPTFMTLRIRPLTAVLQHLPQGPFLLPETEEITSKGKRSKYHQSPPKDGVT